MRVSCYLWLLAVPVVNLTIVKLAVAQERHNYPWSAWVGGLTDGQSKGISFRFRKGDNDFVERGNAFFSIQNRYTVAASGTVAYELVNENTGASRACRSGFNRLAAGHLKEATGDHEPVPGGSGATAAAWEKTRISIRNVRLERLELPDATGAMAQVYPVDVRAQESKKRQEREDAERKQKETQRQQAEQQQKTAEREQAEARQKSAREAAQKAEQQRADAAKAAEDARQQKERERTRQAQENLNQTVANAGSDLVTQVEAFGTSREERQAAEADYNRKVREIDSSAGDSEDSPEVASARRKVRDAESRVAYLEKELRVAEANVNEKQRLASGTTDAIMAATYQAVVVVAQGLQRRASEALDKGRDELSSIQRELDAVLSAPRGQGATAGSESSPNLYGGGGPSNMTAEQALDLMGSFGCTSDECGSRRVEVEYALRRAVQASPDNAEYQYNLGRILLAFERDSTEIEKFLQEAVRLAPKNVDYLSTLAAIEGERGKFALAEEHYLAAVDLAIESRSPMPEFYYSSLLQLLFRQNKFEEAEKYALLAIETNPRYEEARHYYGAVLLSQGRLAEAEDQLLQAVRLDSIPYRSWRMLAEILMRQEKYGEAEEAFLRMKTGYMPGEQNRLGDAMFQQGKYLLAEYNYQKEIDWAQSRRVEWLKEYETERKEWRLPVKQGEAEEAYVNCHNDLGNALFRQGKFEMALLLYRQAVSLKPGDATYSNNANSCLEPLKKSIKGELKLVFTAEDAVLLTAVGRYLEEQKRYTEAEALYREAVKMKPELAKNHCSLGRMLLQQERWRDATAAFQEALRLEPNNAEAKKALKRLK